MTTRLDRLFLLLDSGSTPVIRKSAAEQLGEVQKLHPYELNNLLNKVHSYLHSPSWDTRIAASQAVNAIARNVPQWEPRGGPKQEIDRDSISLDGKLKFSTFDLSKVLHHGASLLGSEGNQFNMETKPAGMDDREYLIQQRQMLNKRLGLDMAGNLKLDIDRELFTDDDLVSGIKGEEIGYKQETRQIFQIVQEQGSLSSREKNRAKRKAKFLARKSSRDSPIPDQDREPPVKKLKSEDNSEGVTGPELSIDIYDEMDWQFDWFCEALMGDLFNSSWENRHGAATGLREIIKLHGRGAGKSMDTPSDQMMAVNQLWLSDLALRLLCVIALDRFGDFVSDEVVAPVRETCAQTLGVVMKFLEIEGIHGVLSILLQLLYQKQWEVRHGGLLGIKYLLAVRRDMTNELLPKVLPFIYQGLRDVDDDVRGVAASALIPVADNLVETLPDQVSVIVNSLWEILVDLDDLTASTNSIMVLLSTLLSYPKTSILDKISCPLTELVPRLWPFLRHNIVSVRKAALKTLNTLLHLQSVQHPSSSWLPPIIQPLLRHIYQRALLETSSEVLTIVEEVWSSLLSKTPVEYVIAATTPWLGVWLSHAMQPSKIPYDNTYMIEAKHRGRVEGGGPKGHVTEQEECGSKSKDKLEYIAGHETVNLSYEDRDVCVTRARTTAAKLLGNLCRYLSIPVPNLPQELEKPGESLAKLLVFHLSTKSAIQRIVIAEVVKVWASCQLHRVSQCTCPYFPGVLLTSTLHNILSHLITIVDSSERGMNPVVMTIINPCKEYWLSWGSKQQPPVLKSAMLPTELWGVASPTVVNSQCPDEVKSKILETLNESVYFDEIGLSFTRMQTDCRDFIASLKQQGINMDQIIPSGILLTPDQALMLVTEVYNKVKSAIKPRSLQTLEDRRAQLHVSILQINNEQQNLSIRTLSSLAKAVIALDAMPDKLNPVIRPLMDCIKKEENESVQRDAAVYLSRLLRKCVAREPSPNSKVLKNLGAFVCCNPNNTPLISMLNNNSTAEITCDKFKGNLTLAKLNKMHEVDRKGLKRVPSLKTDVSMTPDLIQDDVQTQKQLSIQQRGGELALTIVASDFGDKLPEEIPSLWDTVSKYLTINREDIQTMNSEDIIQDAVNSLQVLEVLGPSLHASISRQLLDYLPVLQCYVKCPYTGVRHMGARVVGMLSTLYTQSVMAFVIEEILPMCESTEDETQRQGASEVISNVIEMLNLDIIPYIVLLVVPVLGRMSDQHSDVRILATSCFATLIRLLPLEAGVPDPPDMKISLVEKKLKERDFLQQLMDGSKLENYKIDVPVKAELRKYQQDGVNWLGFLNKYKLHGILCDDMGLGKTLQSICIISSDHFRRAERFKISGTPDCTPLSSIVVCPPTLVGHWVYEVNKFVDKQYLNPLMYAGTPAERMKLQKKVPKHNLIVASYDVVRNDIDFFSEINWNYCVLDEGHIIKNGKTKISKAVKQLNCNHRLILSGTPIQNNVLDLWSLFDFLVPGFLGTEKQFQVRYGKPILASREAKSSSKEQEAGALAMETLHRQVLPFILRRLKEDVLQDLPPKIIQDYYCDLSPLQIKLYEDFSKSQAQRGVEDCIHSSKAAEQKRGSTHVFQALQYLRKVCNHPALVLNANHPKYEEVMSGLKNQGLSIRDVSHAPKLTALRQLLLDCGIGVDDSSGQAPGQTPVVNQHRVLLFCQLKSMLDIVETDLLKSQMPSVTYLRLDGSVPAGSRHDIVNRYNNDPSIDILLLTTHVGGLGLNLTGADTVIFVEHDWNPMKDLQAMDRAHRIGQKKVVNVYRLVTRGTLEEKIMGLQKFKLTIANTVISQDNSSLMTMGTDQLLDLFTLDDRKKGESAAQNANKTEKKETAKSIIENLEELWEDEQYESEYDIQSFMRSLV